MFQTFSLFFSQPTLYSKPLGSLLKYDVKIIIFGDEQLQFE